MSLLTRAALQTFKKVILIAAILLAIMQIVGTEKLGATNIVMDANGNSSLGAASWENASYFETTAVVTLKGVYIAAIDV